MVWLYFWVSYAGVPPHWEMSPAPFTVGECVELAERMFLPNRWYCSTDKNNPPTRITAEGEQ